MIDDTTIRNTVLTTPAVVRPLVESWVRSLRADGKSPRTIENYVGSVRVLSLWCEQVGAPLLPAAALEAAAAGALAAAAMEAGALAPTASAELAVLEAPLPAAGRGAAGCGSGAL